MKNFLSSFPFVILMGALVLGGAWFVFHTVRDESEPVIVDTNAELPDGVVPLEATIDQTVSSFNVKLTPLEVVEDSRCPIDVQCIQAGTVRLRVKLTSGLGDSEQIFVLNMPVTTEAEEITLAKVLPAPMSGRAIVPEDYRFTFTVKKR